MASVDPKQIELVHALADEAWSLPEEYLDAVRPGALGIADAIDVLSFPPPADSPLAPRDEFELLNPHHHFLKLIRQPEFFPFTCRTLFNKPDGSGPLHILPFQHIALTELWWRQFPMLIATRGGGKSFVLALYALLRALFTPGSKIIITAAAFRQAKAVFEYIERLWQNSPVFQSLVNSGHRGGKRGNGPRRDIDRVEFVLGDSVIVGLPLGSGEKIRGLRANYILSDEMASIPEQIYAVVVQGFGSVTADPVGNVKDMARQKLLKRLGLWTREMDAEEAKRVRGNQSVLSGTAYYAFNHFCKYWNEYKRILHTRGNPEALRKLFGGDPPDGFNWRAYSIIRLPYTLVPHGYMDASTIARARQITNTGQFRREYETVFELDSDGFFKRTLIERCVIGSELCDPPTFPSSDGPVTFTAALAGQPQRCKYVFGIDPASESDNFAVAVVEIWPEHRRLVYAWTTRKSDHARRLKAGKTGEHDFYRFAVRRIRDLMKAFPPALLMCDHGGGGVSLREALGDPDKLEPGELPVYEEIDPDGKDKKVTDDFEGLHILRLIRFRDQDWVVEANESLKKDLEDRVLLFPMLDSALLGLAQAADEAAGRAEADDDGETVRPTADTLERAMLDIEETKTELATIVMSETATGNRRWDTPDSKADGAKSGRMRKDRYSALLLANMGARGIMRAPEEPHRDPVVGGFARDFRGRFDRKRREVKLYDGPGWYRRKVAESGGYVGVAVRRGV